MAARAGQTERTQTSAPLSSLNMGMITQKLRSMLPLDYLPDVPIAGIVAEVVALAGFEGRGREEHEFAVGGQRHEAIGETGRDVEDGRLVRREHETVDG